MIQYRCDNCHGFFYVNTESMPYDIVGEIDGKKCKEVYCYCPYCLSGRVLCTNVEEYEIVKVDGQ